MEKKHEIHNMYTTLKKTTYVIILRRCCLSSFLNVVICFIVLICRGREFQREAACLVEWLLLGELEMKSCWFVEFLVAC